MCVTALLSYNYDQSKPRRAWDLNPRMVTCYSRSLSARLLVRMPIENT